MIRKIRRKTVTETTEKITLTDKDIAQLLKVEGDYRVYAEVPGGGDWSNMELDVEKGRPIIIQIKKKEETHEDLP